MPGIRLFAGATMTVVAASSQGRYPRTAAPAWALAPQADAALQAS